MARWESGARERLQRAALDLFDAQGFDHTTAADIAAAAGLTERTFFRYFGDKREALFSGHGVFEQMFVDGAVAVPPGRPPLEVIGAALQAASTFFPDERRDYSRRRDRVIAADAGLRERELLKMANLARLLGETLRDRDVPEPGATLAAELGVTVFRVGFAQWLAEGEDRSMGEILAGLLRETSRLAA
ncbi:TetR family transcriptional regulator [Frigoribacterium sp. 2-23]|uniref:TetR family transcriptional regulator n=1 Tax=Frigoribacterium sp. 2-23 TaxID=3415006 RepID=UPI003C6F8B46